MVQDTKRVKDPNYGILTISECRPDVGMLKRIMPFTDCIHEARILVDREGECILFVRNEEQEQ